MKNSSITVPALRLGLKSLYILLGGGGWFEIIETLFLSLQTIFYQSRYRFRAAKASVLVGELEQAREYLFRVRAVIYKNI